MSTTPTTNYGWLKPVPGTEVDTWGAVLNALFDAIDNDLFTHLATQNQLSEMGDVDLTVAPTTGQLLKYNGTKWVAGLGITDQATLGSRIQVNNTVTQLGNAGAAADYTVRQILDTASLTFQGGNAGNLGGTMVLYGSTHGTKPNRLEFRNGSATVTALIDPTLGFEVSDGSLANPGISFISDPDTGIRRVGANNGALVANGADALQWTDQLVTTVPGIKGGDAFYVPRQTGNDSSRTVYGLATYSKQGSVTGAIVFHAPAIGTNVMHTFNVLGRNHAASNQLVNFSVTGHHGTAGSAFVNMGVSHFGTLRPMVRWGNDPTGNPCLIVGDITTGWTHPAVALGVSLLNYTGIADAYCKGWTTELVTDLSLYTNLSSDLSTSDSGLGAYAPLAGATFTGVVTVDANLNNTGGFIQVDRSGDAVTAQIFMKSDVANICRIYGYKNNPPSQPAGSYQRWLMDLGDASAESTANAGSDFSLFRCNDAGSSIEAALNIVRSTGITEARRGLKYLVSQRNATGLVLVNGANNDVAVPAGNATFLRITGPSAAFSITGITTGSTYGDGHILILESAITGFAMTIANDNAGSVAANRIYTLTGADLVLRAGRSSAVLIYDGVLSRWIVVAYNG